jgi:site-specific recombinase XerD
MAFRAVLDARPEPHVGALFPRWTSPDTASHVVKAALTEAGFGHLHLHHLRHSFGAAFVEAGGDVRTLMELLGHRQISTTLIYTKLSPEHLAKEVDRVQLPEASNA